jgi:hypothetical protein
MKIKIYWNGWQAEDLLEKVNLATQELWLNDFITSEITSDESLKSELNISKEPALIIEEESISFKDMIFEWMIPEIDELKSMFISIVWGWESSSEWEWCGTWGCGSCSSGC